MALVLPLLLALTFMMFEGAYYIWNEHKVVMGVRDAARFAGRQDFINYTCPSTINTTKLAEIKNITRTGQISGGNSRISGWTDGDVTVSLTCATGQGGLYGAVSGNAPRVKISANVLYPSLIGTTLGFSTAMRMGAVAESPVMGL